MQWRSSTLHIQLAATGFNVRDSSISSLYIMHIIIHTVFNYICLIDDFQITDFPSNGQGSACICPLNRGWSVHRVLLHACLPAKPASPPASPCHTHHASSHWTSWQSERRRIPMKNLLRTKTKLTSFWPDEAVMSGLLHALCNLF